MFKEMENLTDNINMKSLIFASILIFTQACDQPTRTRIPSNQTGTSGNTQNFTDPAIGDEDGGGGDNVTPVNPGEGGDQMPGFENCILDYQYFVSNIGSFALCQNQNQENRFKLKMQNSDLQHGTCFVPVHVQSNNQSFKLGIAECVKNQAGREYNMILTKERGEAINGVMVVKATAINAYMQCMSAKVDFISAYPGCQYDAACMQAADNYANSVCTQFVQVYSNDYKQVYPLD